MSSAYARSGVNYSSLDPFKKLAQKKAKETADNLKDLNFSEVFQSRGESAYVWEEQDSYKAFVVEGLGTKNLVADEMRKITGKTYYDQIAQDVVAAIINDLIVVGTKPLCLGVLCAVGKSEWFDDTERSNDLAEGFAKACNIAEVTWGGGESPSLSGIINPNSIVLAGSAVGIIKPKKRLILGDKLTDGDTIILLESSGIHTNGLSLARSIANELPEGYSTKIINGQTFGESLLTPSHIYSKLVSDLLESGIEIHYMVHITGHGFRKLMRANKDFTYEINNLPPVHEVFKFIQEKTNLLDEDMYGTFNMGAGFAAFVPSNMAEKVIEVASKNGFKAWNAGEVKAGPKQVIINPLNITFSSKTLDVR